MWVRYFREIVLQSHKLLSVVDNNEQQKKDNNRARHTYKVAFKVVYFRSSLKKRSMLQVKRQYFEVSKCLYIALLWHSDMIKKGNRAIMLYPIHLISDTKSVSPCKRLLHLNAIFLLIQAYNLIYHLLVNAIVGIQGLL